MPKRIAVLVTQDYADADYADPVEAFRAARHSISNIEHSAGRIIYGKARTSCITIDQSIDDVCIDDFDALLIPGGYSPDQLRSDVRFTNFVRQFAQAEKLIMSVCDAPQLLINAEVVKGRLMTTAKNIAHDLIDAGAVYYDVDVVNDNNLYISSRAQNSLPAFIKESLMALKC